jgi:hypothetical protein
MAKLEDRIAKLEEKLKQVKAQKAQSEARHRASQAKAERAADTRRKVLLGAWVMEQWEGGKISRDEVLSGLRKFLVRPNDLALFGLDVPKETTGTPKGKDPTPTTDDTI